MRTPNIGSVPYSPDPAPSDPDQFRQYIENEFRKISAALQRLQDGHVDKTYAAPPKPREGDIRLADGTSWNPGSGAGFYGYRGGAWHLLG